MGYIIAGAHIQGVSIHKTLSEDDPSLSPTLSTQFVTLHEALKVSAGKVDLIHPVTQKTDS